MLAVPLKYRGKIIVGSWDVIVGSRIFMPQASSFTILTPLSCTLVDRCFCCCCMQAPVSGDVSDDVSPLEHCSGTPLSEALGGGGLACPVGLRVGVSVPSAVAQAVLEGVFWCR